MLDLDKFREDHQSFHSEFQIDNFIVRKNGVTTWGQYKQALRELLSRESSLKSLYVNIRQIEIDLDEVEYEIDILKASQDIKDGFELRRKELDRLSCIEGLKGSEDTLKDTIREFTRFYNITAHLKDKLGDITPEKRLKLEDAHWLYSTKKKIAEDVMETGTISLETRRSINAFPTEKRIELRRLLANKDEVREMATNFDSLIPLDLPSGLDKPVENIQKFIGDKEWREKLAMS
jgi:hypothetical protein